MVVEVDAHEPDQQKRGGHERTEQMHRLSDQCGTRHLGRRNAVRLPRFGENRQDTEIESVVRNEERERDTERAGHDGEIGTEHGRHESNDALRHGIDHLRTGQNTGEDAGGENEAHDRQHVSGVP